MNNLHVLHISTTDKKGGSGRSAYRIHSSLRDYGINSKMLVGYKSTNDPDVNYLSKNILKFIDRICNKFMSFYGLSDIFYPSSFFLLRHPLFKKCNILQLYNIHGNYFSFLSLPFLSNYKPIVWRLSDMWPLTGHCGYSYECEKWINGCGNCPHLEEYPPLKKDRTTFLWKLKKNVMNKIKNMVIVAPSLWIKNLVKKSPILSKFPILYIPNGVNTETFKNCNKMKIMGKLGISPNKKVILFIAEDFYKDKRKGGMYLIEALRLLDKSFLKNLVLLIIGKNNVNAENMVPVDIIKTGPVSNDIQLAEFYSAADLMVLPTLADNLPNTLLESMSCGTPVVAFNNGGIAEVIKHMENGYLVKNREIEELARALKLSLSNDILLKRLSENCRNYICKNFSQDKEIKKYIELYSELIKNGKSFYG